MEKQSGRQHWAVIFILTPLPNRVLQASYCTHFFYGNVLQTIMGMGMGMNVTAQARSSRWRTSATGLSAWSRTCGWVVCTASPHTKNPQDSEYRVYILWGSDSFRGNPVLVVKDLLESNPLKSRCLVRGLAVRLRAKTWLTNNNSNNDHTHDLIMIMTIIYIYIYT